MTLVLANERLLPNIYRLTVAGDYQAVAGQFYMLRCWETLPLLSRPISIHDINEGSLSFLYRVNGLGTRLLSELCAGEYLGMEGPYGQGFPEPIGRVALVGGGIGIAPLLLATKRLPHSQVFLGFRDEPFGVQEFLDAHSDVTVVSGGTIADYVDTGAFDTIYACGPVPLMKQLALKADLTNTQLYVSIEKRMGCGIGACNSCTVKIAGTNHKVCIEGPVFPSRGVNLDDLLNL